MDQFFHNINRRLNDIAKKQTVTESAEPVAERATGDYSAKKARAGKDIGKPGKMFSKIAKSAGEKYGSKERGEKVAGAVLAKLRAKESVDESDMDESALQAYLGKKKYGEAGMKALQKAGREGASKEKMARIRAQHDKMDEQMADEGNAFTAKLKATPKGGEFELDGKKYKDTSNIEEKKEPRSKGTAFDKEHMDKLRKEKEAETHGRYDVKDTGYSKRYTRKPEPEEKDDAEVSTEPKKKGRPKGPAKGPERVTKGAWKHKGERKAKKEKTEEDLDTDGVMMTTPSNMSSEGIESVAMIDKGEFDREGEMAKQQIHTIMRAAKNLHKMLGDDDNLPEWVQKKITLAQNYIDGVADYLASQRAEAGEEEPIAEKAVSQQQQKFMGMAHAMQKGERIPGASKELKKVAKTMKPKDVKDFAATKHAGLPKKVKEEGKPDFIDLDKDGNKTEPMKQAAKQAKSKKKEETDEGAMSGAEVKDVKNPAPKSSGGMQFGKGVYESMNMKLNQVLNEGMNVSVNASTGANGEPTKNITISADGDDAEALATLLKMAGMGSYKSVCPGCGSTDCGCQEIDENSPDWPTNTEEIDADPNLRTYSGGLNGPKSTGQTTVPVIASQLRRQTSMDESVELERSLFKLYQNYKAK